MDIIPAIDLKGGLCVRLVQGEESKVTTYSNDPVGVARSWEEQGAHLIHVVNLDGAFGRQSDNHRVLEQLCGAVSARVQYGGGLRTLKDIDGAIEAGASRIVLGTAALENPDLVRSAVDRFGADRVVIALDTKGGMIATRGWTHVTTMPLAEAALNVRGAGVSRVLWTSVERDGMMTGPETGLLGQVTELGLDVQLSGGVRSHADILALVGLGNPRLAGVIIGKALFEGAIDLRKALEEVRRC